MESIANRHQPGLAHHDSSMLDLAFALDCTSSMSPYIQNAQKNIYKIVEEIVAGEKSDIRMALVKYRDHPPQDSSFVTEVLDLTSSIKTMKREVDRCTAEGGGDLPEAVADALYDVYKLTWRENATKICVLVSDAPPHGLVSHGDGFPNGCPNGLDPVQIVRSMAGKGIVLYSIGCEPEISAYRDFFAALAHITGGQYVPLSNSALLAKVIIGGAQEEVTLERLMSKVHDEVQQAADRGGEVDERRVARQLHAVMKKKCVKAKRLRMNRKVLNSSSARAIKWSEMPSLKEVKKDFKELRPSPAPLRAKGRKRKNSDTPSRKKSACKKLRVTRKGKSMVGSGSSRCNAGGKDSFDIEEEDISEDQVWRLVRKSVQRQKLKSKSIKS